MVDAVRIELTSFGLQPTAMTTSAKRLLNWSVRVDSNHRDAGLQSAAYSLDHRHIKLEIGRAHV